MVSLSNHAAEVLSEQCESKGARESAPDESA